VLRLSLKTGQGLRIAGYVVGQKFDGDEAVQARVLGLIDDAHAATAEFLEDAVVRDGLADHVLADHVSHESWKRNGRRERRASQRME
jgi:hypothetical protein